MNDRTNRAAPARPAAPAADPPKGKKRPAWDVKGRLEDMEALMKLTSGRVEMLESQNTELKTNVEEKETVVIQNTEELNNLKNEKGTLEAEVSGSGLKKINGFSIWAQLLNLLQFVWRVLVLFAHFSCSSINRRSHGRV